jgi:hypothetical protein
MSEHTIKRNQLPRLRKLLENIPFEGHDHPDDRDRVIVEVEPEYDHLVTKGIPGVSGTTPDAR